MFQKLHLLITLLLKSQEELVFFHAVKVSIEHSTPITSDLAEKGLGVGRRERIKWLVTRYPWKHECL